MKKKNSNIKRIVILLISLLVISSIPGIYCLEESNDVVNNNNESVEAETTDLESSEYEDLAEDDFIEEEISATETENDLIIEEEGINDSEYTSEKQDESLEEDITGEGSVSDDDIELPDEYIPHYVVKLQKGQRFGDCGIFAMARNMEILYYNKYGKEICIDAWVMGYETGRENVHIEAMTTASASGAIWHTCDGMLNEGIYLPEGYVYTGNVDPTKTLGEYLNND